MASGIRAGRPHDLEPLEHRLDHVMHCKTFPFCLPREVVAMVAEPRVSAPVALAFIPGKLVVDGNERFDRDLRRPVDALRLALTINDAQLRTG
jgi:hypothetical protein